VDSFDRRARQLEAGNETNSRGVDDKGRAMSLAAAAVSADHARARCGLPGRALHRFMIARASVTVRAHHRGTLVPRFTALGGRLVRPLSVAGVTRHETRTLRLVIRQGGASLEASRTLTIR
jgi:hypothetical protein